MANVSDETRDRGDRGSPTPGDARANGARLAATDRVATARTEGRSGVTPMIHQYLQIKERHQDAIVFFRMGDFYEMFFEDAQLASRELGIALTSRSKPPDEEIPFCGVPWHSSSQYVSRLLARGYKVVICEQKDETTPGRAGKGLMTREAVRILTPGLAVEEDLLQSGDHRYLMAVYAEPGGGGEGLSGARYGMAKLDFTTGDFHVAEASSLREVLSEIMRARPPELIVRKVKGCRPDPVEALRQATRDWLAQPSNLAAVEFDPDEEEDAPPPEPGSTDLAPLQRKAAALCLYYLKQHHFSVPPHIGAPQPYALPAHLWLDDTTMRNLELVANLRDRTPRHTLWDVLNRTVTSMGKRRLMEWLLYPLLDMPAIERRLDAVEEGVREKEARNALRQRLSGLTDLERLNARNAMAQSLPRELLALRATLGRLPEIRRRMESWACAAVRELARGLDVAPDLLDLLERALADDPPSSAREGGVIKPGYSAELDELRAAVENGHRWLVKLEREERERTGIPTLKIRHHQVFGYLLEVTRSHLARVPADYQRKQTLAGAERFKVDRLIQAEEKILGAEEKGRALEQRLFDELRAVLAGQSGRLKGIAATLATVDALLSLAEVAEDRRFVRPRLAQSPVLRLIGARHPVLETLLQREPFVENDIILGGDQPPMWIITGPNMAGKSTTMRQAALAVILAQMGSFVPAREALVGIADRVFTRIGASDDLAAGKSTFMVEMEEVATILAQATERSVILVDEIGRGTSTYDGVAIAWAVAEYLADRVGARTLFATHYHDLIRLGEEKDRIKNVHIAVKEWGEKIIFLRKVREGGTSKSYGIQVARLAGVPEDVVARARTMLFAYEQQRTRDLQPQHLLFSSTRAEPLGEELKSIRVDALTPLEALQVLSRLVDRARESA